MNLLLNGVFVKIDVEDIFQPFVRNIGSLTVDDSLITLVVAQDTQYSWFDNYRPSKSNVFNEIHIVYDWYKQHYDTHDPPS